MHSFQIANMLVSFIKKNNYFPRLVENEGRIIFISRNEGGCSFIKVSIEGTERIVVSFIRQENEDIEYSESVENNISKVQLLLKNYFEEMENRSKMMVAPKKKKPNYNLVEDENFNMKDYFEKKEKASTMEMSRYYGRVMLTCYEYDFYKAVKYIEYQYRNLNVTDAEELVSDAYMEFGSYNPTKSSPRTYIIEIAKNKANNKVTRSKEIAISFMSRARNDDVEIESLFDMFLEPSKSAEREYFDKVKRIEKKEENKDIRFVSDRIREIIESGRKKLRNGKFKGKEVEKYPVLFLRDLEEMEDEEIHEFLIETEIKDWTKVGSVRSSRHRELEELTGEFADMLEIPVERLLSEPKMQRRLTNYLSNRLNYYYKDMTNEEISKRCFPKLEKISNMIIDCMFPGGEFDKLFRKRCIIMNNEGKYYTPGWKWGHQTRKQKAQEEERRIQKIVNKTDEEDRIIKKEVLRTRKEWKQFNEDCIQKELNREFDEKIDAIFDAIWINSCYLWKDFPQIEQKCKELNISTDIKF